MAKARILIVEDEAIIASVIAAALRKFNYDVIDILSSGETAVEAALKSKPDLLLMDIRLQGALDGIAAVERIQPQADIPVIYLTAYADEPTLERAKKTKPYGYIPKPFQEIELKTTIEMALYKHGFEIQLRESEERFRTLFENSQDVIYIVDRSWRLQEMNPAGVRLFGYRRDELIGREPDFLYADSGDRKQFLAELRAKRVLKDYEVRLRNRHGDEIRGRITANAIIDQSGEMCGIQGIIRDITKEKKIEEQMIQAAKMDSLGSLAGGIAHDFKNYLTIINGYSEMLLGERPQGAEQESLNIILQAGKNASKLVTKILGFSRSQAALPVIIDVNDAIRELERMVRRLLGQKIELALDLHPGTGRARIDPTQLEQVLINLVLNARDAMPAGGKLTVSTLSIEPDDSMTVEHPQLQAGAYAAIRMRDEGTGMEPEVLARIFEPFFTTKPQGEGTGLGLASVFAIVGQNGGGVWAESAPGRGSTFHILLPQASEGGAARPASRRELRFEGRTALLVEDEREVRDLMRAILESLGLEVHAAGDGKQALAEAEKMARVDLLFCDVVLPGLSGVEVSERLRKRHPGAAVIFSSGQSEFTLKRAGLDLNKVHFLPKPSSRKEIEEKIAEALGG